MGFALVQTAQLLYGLMFKPKVSENETAEEKRKREREENKFTGMIGTTTDANDDPDSIHKNDSENLGVLVAESQRLQAVEEEQATAEIPTGQVPILDEEVAVEDGKNEPSYNAELGEDQAAI